MKQLDIAVDFDGTVVTHEFPNVGKDIGAEPVLKRLVEAGHRLILFTMRGNVTNNTGHSGDPPVILNGNFLDDAKKWFEDRSIPLYGCQCNPTQAAWTTSPKCYAHLYIDDAALGAPLKRDADIAERPFIDWEAVENIFEMDGILPPTSDFISAMREDMAANNQKSPFE